MMMMMMIELLQIVKMLLTDLCFCKTVNQCNFMFYTQVIRVA